jgi:hypothetical protein
MRTRIAATLVTSAAVLASGSARADLYTPSFIVDDGETAVCHILSRAKKPVALTIEVRFNNSAVATTSGPIEIAPGEVRSATFDGTNSSRVHCAFLGKVKLKTARAAGDIVVDNKTTLSIPAQ